MENTINKDEQKFLNDIAEYYIFDKSNKWIDESCGNFVGWVREFDNFTFSVDRENTAVSGLYNISKMKKGYRAHFDYDEYLISTPKTQPMTLYNLVNYIKCCEFVDNSLNNI